MVTGLLRRESGEQYGTKGHGEDREGRPCENGGRHGSDVSAKQGMSGTASSTWGDRHGTDFIPGASIKNQPAHTLILDFWPPNCDTTNVLLFSNLL